MIDKEMLDWKSSNGELINDDIDELAPYKDLLDALDVECDFDDDEIDIYYNPETGEYQL